MAENSRMSKLSEKDDECIFSWKLFTAWDYMIGNAETAHNRVASIVMGFKEALLEEAEKKRESRNWKVICFRVLVNTLVVGLLSCSAFAVVIVVRRSTEPEANTTVWRRNEITVVMSLISLFFPMLFEVLGLVEQYHPRKQLRLQLARIMVLNLLNLYSLIFALFDKISDMTLWLQEIKTNLSKPQTVEIYTTPSTTFSDYSSVECFCHDSSLANQTLISLDMLVNLAQNLSTLATPTLNSLVKSSSEESFLNSTLTADYSTVSWYENSTTTSTDFELSVDDVKNYFVDYLTFILSSFSASVVANNDSNITTPDYDYFKSTLLPLFNNTTPQEEQRVDTELTTLFEEVTSTIVSFPDLFTTTSIPLESEVSTENFDSYYCRNYCRSFWSSKSTTTFSYGEPEHKNTLNYTMNAKLRSLCWETMFGQELIKLTVMDLIVTGLSILMMDFFRGIFVRVMNRCWCWDLEKKFPQYGDFKVAENILHLVNNQGMVWMGMFFSPGLVVLNVIKLYIMMYLRAWAVLTCNVPHEIIFRASRSNNFYYALLLMMLFLCVLPVGYAIVKIEPSWHCGPFSGYQKIFHIFTKTIRANVPDTMHGVLDYIASPGIVIPLLLLLVLIIYYLISLTGALREANNDLKIQLRRERTEERRKMFQLADRRRRGGSGESNDQTPFSKWKKLLGNLPTTRSCEDARQESDEVVPSQREEDDQETEEKVENKGKVFFTKLIKKALRKSSTSDEEQDATDTDQHDSLPYDNARQGSKEHTSLRKTSSAGSKEMQTLQSIVSKWSLRRNSQKSEKDVPGDLQDKEEVKGKKKSSLKVAVHKSTSSKPKDTSPEHHKHRGEKEENVFLKRVIEAKNLSISEDKEEGKRATKNKSKKPLVEPNEEACKKEKRIKNKTRKSALNLEQEIITEPSAKKSAERQDSSSSVWSDKIPVITISKTPSNENILDKSDLCQPADLVEPSKPVRKFVFKDSSDEDDVDGSEAVKGERTRFRPRVKCLLRKQAAAIDEDAIIHFGGDLERIEAEKRMILDLVNPKTVENEEDNFPSTSSHVVDLEAGSTSDDTEIKDDDDDSVDTILNSPYYATVGSKDKGSSVESLVELEVEAENTKLQRPSLKNGSRSQTE